MWNQHNVLLFAGSLSWRKTDAGSWFMQAIVWVFKSESHVKDLVEMLGKVRLTHKYIYQMKPFDFLVQ